MKRISIFCLAALCGLCHGAELYVYSSGGGAVETLPRELPSVGVRLDGGGTVLGLHGADDATKAACGWYRVADVPATPAGMRVASRTLRIDGAQATYEVRYEPIPERNRTLSKFKMVEAIERRGKLAQFMALLDADPALRFKWDAAVLLDSTNAMVRAARAAMPQALGVTDADADAILREAAVR